MHGEEYGKEFHVTFNDKKTNRNGVWHKQC